MAEIVYSAQSATAKNAYREGTDLLLLDGCSLPDICVACGNAAYGNVERKEFSNANLWVLLPAGLDLLAFFLGDKFVFDFPFCSNCPPYSLRLTPTRLRRDLIVLRGAPERLLALLPPPPPEVAEERKRSWFQRQFRHLQR